MRKRGHYKIAPTADEVTNKQMYWPETDILVTRFLSPDGVGEVIDFMPAGSSKCNGDTINYCAASPWSGAPWRFEWNATRLSTTPGMPTRRRSLPKG